MKGPLRLRGYPLFVTICVASLAAIVVALGGPSYPPWSILWNWSDRTSSTAPKPRQAHTTVNCDGLMIVYGGFGGQHEQDFFKDTWVWDTRAETGKWHKLDGQWLAGGTDGTLRATHATAAWYDESTKLCTLISFAGVTHSGTQQLYDRTVLSLSLDPKQVRDWIAAQQSHVGSTGWAKLSASGNAPQHRNEHIMVAHGNDFYVHGGMYISVSFQWGLGVGKREGGREGGGGGKKRCRTTNCTFSLSPPSHHLPLPAPQNQGRGKQRLQPHHLWRAVEAAQRTRGRDHNMDVDQGGPRFWQPDATLAVHACRRSGPRGGLYQHGGYQDRDLRRQDILQKQRQLVADVERCLGVCILLLLYYGSM